MHDQSLGLTLHLKLPLPAEHRLKGDGHLGLVASSKDPGPLFTIGGVGGAGMMECGILSLVA